MRVPVLIGTWLHVQNLATISEIEALPENRLYEAYIEQSLWGGKVTIKVGQPYDDMYIGFGSDVLPPNKITDFIIRVAQPRLQSVAGVQTAELLGAFRLVCASRRRAARRHALPHGRGAVAERPPHAPL